MPPAARWPARASSVLLGTAVAAVSAGAVPSCTAGANPDTLYQRGMEAYRGHQMGPAADNLDAFAAKACRPPKPDARCRKANMSLARAREAQDSPAGAWAAYDAALGFPPHDTDDQVRASRDQAQQDLVARNGSAADHGPVLVRYRDEVSEEYTPRSVVISLDFEAVLTQDKDAASLHSADFRKVYGGSIPAGEHVLVIETVHDCRPGGGPCARAHVRKAWPFRNAPHTPTTIEVRAYAEEGGADAPARPAIDVSTR